MPTRIQFGAIIIVIVLVWTIAVIFRGGAFTIDHLMAFTSVSFLAPFLLYLYDKFFWKLPGLLDLLTHLPVIDGTWKVKIKSSYKNEEHPNGVEIDAILVVRQSFSRIRLRIFTSESSSVSLSAEISEADEGIYKIAYSYQNDPKTHLRGDRSEIHYGAATITFNGRRPKNGAGEYWTDRLSKGSLDLIARSRSHAGGYAEGLGLFV